MQDHFVTKTPSVSTEGPLVLLTWLTAWENIGLFNGVEPVVGHTQEL